jgi:hypothetical protein
MKLRDSAGQTHAYAWKDPNDGFAESLDSRDSYGKLPSELAKVFRGTGVAPPTDISNHAPHPIIRPQALRKSADSYRVHFLGAYLITITSAGDDIAR